MRPLPKKPGRNDKLYYNYRFSPYFHFGLRESARRMNMKSVTTLHRMIKQNKIEHVLVNGRPFIPEYAILKHTNKDHKIRSVCAQTEGIKIYTHTMEGLISFLERFGFDSYDMSVVDMEIAEWSVKNKPPEIIHGKDSLLYLKGDAVRFINPELIELKYRKLEESLYTIKYFDNNDNKGKLIVNLADWENIKSIYARNEIEVFRRMEKSDFFIRLN